MQFYFVYIRWTLPPFWGLHCPLITSSISGILILNLESLFQTLCTATFNIRHNHLEGNILLRYTDLFLADCHFSHFSIEKHHAFIAFFQIVSEVEFFQHLTEILLNLPQRIPLSVVNIHIHENKFDLWYMWVHITWLEVWAFSSGPGNISQSWVGSLSLL